MRPLSLIAILSQALMAALHFDRIDCHLHPGHQVGETQCDCSALSVFPQALITALHFEHVDCHQHPGI